MGQRDSNSTKDRVFNTPQENIAPFEFNENVAQVFDDMISRSIPFYAEIHKLIIDMCLRHYKAQGNIVDLGCSTGTTIALLDQAFGDKNPQYVGIDLSVPMIELAKQKCSTVKNCQFLVEDMTQYSFENAEVVILNYTLQFLKKEGRLPLLKKIYNSLPKGGVIIISEKITVPDQDFESLITDLYYDFKRRNGYSELEISQKREALENVLEPISPKEQLAMIQEAGFSKSDMLFRWYNFASYVGIK
jgi:tRNA (cmo5U34)-methyltransferase